MSGLWLFWVIALAWGNVLAASQAQTTTGTAVSFTITRDAVPGAPDPQLPANITVWGQYPISFLDQYEYGILSILNPASGTPTTTPAPDDGGEGFLDSTRLTIILSVSVVALLLVAFMIWYGVRQNKASPSNRVAPAYGPVETTDDGTGQQFRPPPRATSKKVIPIPIVHYQAPPAAMSRV